MRGQTDELQKFWSVIADHQLLLPAFGVAVLGLIVWGVLRALRRDRPRGP